MSSTRHYDDLRMLIDHLYYKKNYAKVLQICENYLKTHTTKVNKNTLRELWDFMVRCHFILQSYPQALTLSSQLVSTKKIINSQTEYKIFIKKKKKKVKT